MNSISLLIFVILYSIRCKKVVFLSLLLVGLNLNCVQAQEKRVVDSLNQLLSTKINDTTMCRVYIKLARQYWDVLPDTLLTRKNQEQAVVYAKKALEIAEKVGFLPGIAEAYYIHGYVLYDQHKHLDAIGILKKSIWYYKEAENEKGLSNINFVIGNVYYDIGDMENSLKYFQECLRLDLKRGDSAEAAGIYSNIANIYFQSGNSKDAIVYWQKAIKINEVTGNKDWLAINHYLIGGSLNGSGSFKQSLEEYKIACRLFLESNNEGQYAMALLEVGKNLTELKYYQASLDSCYKALKVLRGRHDRNGVAYSFNILGMTYTRMGKYNTAASYLDSCYKICLTLNAVAMANVYQRLYQLDSTRGDGAAAFLHYRKYIEFKEKIYSKEKNQAINNLKLKFEYSLKEEQEALELQQKEAQEKLIRYSLFVVIILLLVIAFILLNRMRLKQKANILLAQQKARSDELLLNILPESVAEELKQTGKTKAKHFEEISVMFTDFKGFTAISESMNPEELVEEIHTCFKAFDEIIEQNGLEKIKTIGDAYMCAGGLSNDDSNHAKNMVNAALEIQSFMKSLGESQQKAQRPIFEIRIGIHTGPVVAGVVGVKKFAYDIWGDTVNTANRMESSCETGKVNISEATYLLVKDFFYCTTRGKVEVKSKGELNMYYVDGII